MIDPDLKDLVQRVTIIEQDWKIYAWVFGGIGLLLAAVFGIRLENLFGWAEKKAQDKIKKTIEKSQLTAAEAAAKKYLEASAAALTEIDRARTETIKAGIEARKLISEGTGVEHTPGVIVQRGENEISLVNEGYRRAKITFAKEFSSVPSVFVGEAVAGEWIFVKVDAKDTKGFVWAARTLTGISVTRKTIVQWVAIGIALQDGQEPAGAKFVLEA